MTYDGKTWSAPLQADSHGAEIASLSCASADLCVAVDNQNYAFVFAPTTTTITSTTPQPSVGQAVKVGVEVSSGVSTRTPTGSVEVTDGFRTCTAASLAGSGGVATASCSITEDAPGSYPLVAIYEPNGSFGGSTSTSSPLSVGQETSATSLALSAGRVVYGHEQVPAVTVTVDPEYSGLTPTGTVTVKAGSTSVCSVALSSGTASCTLAARELTAGRYRLVAAYAGNADLRGSTSAGSTLSVTKQSAPTTIELSARRITYGDEQAERVSVTVSPEFPGSIATGKVAVRKSTTTLCVINLAKGKGSCKLPSSKLKAGTYRLFAAYLGSANFARTTSANKALTVVS
jgi:hypothetical protein